MPNTRALAAEAKAWPFDEARKLLDRVEGRTPDKGYVLFETGYGPSGLPHIGTVGEVLRTNKLRHAFQCMSEIPTRLYDLSDYMDGPARVADDGTNSDTLTQHSTTTQNQEVH